VFPQARVAEALAAFGYLFVWRDNGWTECLASRGDERWFGHGIDRIAAFADVVRQMFPSSGARRLLEASLVHVDDSMHSLEEARSRERAASEHSSPGPSNGRLHVDSSNERINGVRDTAVQVSALDVAPDSGHRSDIHPMTADELLETVVAIESEIHESTSEIALMSSRLQQLHMLAWICRARALAEAMPSVPSIRVIVGRIARILSRCGKIWWPGNVPALRIDARPEDIGGLLRQGSHPPTTWSLAGLWTEQAIETLALRDDLDDFGWADRLALVPPPADPAAVLEDVWLRVEALLGPLGDGPSYDDEDKLCDLSNQDLEQLLDIARRARWVRPVTNAPERWGLVIGRLRWIAHKLAAKGAKLGDLLDYQYRPPSTWAAMLETMAVPERASETPSIEHVSTVAVAGVIIADKVREHTEGKRVLFVSRRDDPELQQRLQLELGARIHWCDGSPLRVQAQVERISGGSYDWVLAATGFMDHDVYFSLSRAAKAAGIRYVTACPGRVTACVLAIARDLGLSDGRGNAAS